MHISVICDLDVCIYDAGFFRYKPTNQPTNEQGYSRSRIAKVGRPAGLQVETRHTVALAEPAHVQKFSTKTTLSKLKANHGQNIAEYC